MLMTHSAERMTGGEKLTQKYNFINNIIY